MAQPYISGDLVADVFMDGPPLAINPPLVAIQPQPGVQLVGSALPPHKPKVAATKQSGRSNRSGSRGATSRATMEKYDAELPPAEFEIREAKVQFFENFHLHGFSHSG